MSNLVGGESGIGVNGEVPVVVAIVSLYMFSSNQAVLAPSVNQDMEGLVLAV